MNKKLLKRSFFINALVGLGVIVSLIYDLKIRGVNISVIQLHVFFGIVQLIIFGLTLFFFNNHLGLVNEDCDSITVEYKELSKLNRLIIDTTPTGLVLLNRKGIIEYVNQSTGNILGSTKTVGLNILEFDTIKQSKLHNGIVKASTGIYTEILGEHYTSFTSRLEKILNIYISPVIDEKDGNVANIILFIHDITKEHDLKVEIEKTYLSTIEAFAEMVDARDKYTGKHSKNVYQYVSMICEELDLDEKIKTQIQVAANIHDLGKIGISDSLLNKPGRLTNAEYDSIKKHAALGAEIISKIIGFEDISLIIRHHHERWDGTGYLEGLKDSEIPLGSQIIAIADTYDAITTDRVYRKKLGREMAIKILQDEKGKQFNPDLVDIFIEKITQ
ncbi:HD domain-containing phosphohydrolase [Desulfosporosinus sp. Sb-LF]|uniref:HD domain-containing phosphohydrolase n=1 Tax=Desulfosporosinus sp. Sb-LF TaxID=2560027 RepID=UPI00107F96F0|nr:HD domain-containing phosphohydrolase [Desulfosporosinus sp. Sb-LF]TGE33204.1 HD domain-containing protein [Desulfosporosinus sp. Sb-LF]